MKFSTQTLSVIKNLGQIYPGLYFRKGSKLSTLSDSKSVLAIARIEEDIPIDFAIHDLSRFLSALSLFPDFELEFTNKYLLIKSGNKSTKYVYADPAVINKPPEKELTLQEEVISFTLSESEYTGAMRAASVIDATHLNISGNDGKLDLSVLDIKNPTGDTYSVELGDTEKTFNYVFKMDNIAKLRPDDYDVTIFRNKAGNKVALLARLIGKYITYYVALEQESSVD